MKKKKKEKRGVNDILLRLICILHNRIDRGQLDNDNANDNESVMRFEWDHPKWNENNWLLKSNEMKNSS